MYSTYYWYCFILVQVQHYSVTIYEYFSYSRSGYRRRIGWFSNPSIVIANLTLGAEDTEDTARLLRDNLADMAAVGDEQTACSD